jgi:hypothetical protein
MARWPGAGAAWRPFSSARWPARWSTCRWAENLAEWPALGAGEIGSGLSVSSLAGGVVVVLDLAGMGRAAVRISSGCFRPASAPITLRPISDEASALLRDFPVFTVDATGVPVDRVRWVLTRAARPRRRISSGWSTSTGIPTFALPTGGKGGGELVGFLLHGAWLAGAGPALAGARAAGVLAVAGPVLAVCCRWLLERLGYFTETVSAWPPGRPGWRCCPARHRRPTAGRRPERWRLLSDWCGGASSRRALASLLQCRPAARAAPGRPNLWRSQKASFV